MSAWNDPTDRLDVLLRGTPATVRVETNAPIPANVLEELVQRAIEYADAELRRDLLNYDFHVEELSVRSRVDAADLAAPAGAVLEAQARTLGHEIAVEIRRVRPALNEMLIFRARMKTGERRRGPAEVLAALRAQQAGNYRQQSVARIVPMSSAAFGPAGPPQAASGTGPFFGQDGSAISDPNDVDKIEINEGGRLTGPHRKHTFAGATEDMAGEPLAQMMRKIGYSDYSVRQTEERGEYQALIIIRVGDDDRKRRFDVMPINKDTLPVLNERSMPLAATLQQEKDAILAGDPNLDRDFKKWGRPPKFLHEFLNLGWDRANPSTLAVPTPAEFQAAHDVFFRLGARTIPSLATSPKLEERLGAGLRTFYATYYGTFDLWSGQGFTVLPDPAEERTGGTLDATGNVTSYTYDFSINDAAQDAFATARAGVREFAIKNLTFQEFGARGVDWDIFVMDDFARAKAARDAAARARAAASSGTPVSSTAGSA